MDLLEVSQRIYFDKLDLTLNIHNKRQINFATFYTYKMSIRKSLFILLENIIIYKAEEFFDGNNY